MCRICSEEPCLTKTRQRAARPVTTDHKPQTTDHRPQTTLVSIIFQCLIPTAIDQNSWAHLRMPVGHDLLHGWSMRLPFQVGSTARRPVFVGFEDPDATTSCAHVGRHCVHRLWNSGDRGGGARTVMVGETLRRLGALQVPRPAGDQHRMGTGRRRLTDERRQKAFRDVAPGPDPEVDRVPLAAIDLKHDQSAFGVVMRERTGRVPRLAELGVELILLADAPIATTALSRRLSGASPGSSPVQPHRRRSKKTSRLEVF